MQNNEINSLIVKYERVRKAQFVAIVMFSLLSLFFIGYSIVMNAPKVLIGVPAQLFAVIIGYTNHKDIKQMIEELKDVEKN